MDNVIDKYIDAAKAASDSLLEHGCSVSGLSIDTARESNGNLMNGRIALEIYVPASETASISDDRA